MLGAGGWVAEGRELCGSEAMHRALRCQVCPPGCLRTSVFLFGNGIGGEEEREAGQSHTHTPPTTVAIPLVSLLFTPSNWTVSSFPVSGPTDF